MDDWQSCAVVFAVLGVFGSFGAAIIAMLWAASATRRAQALQNTHDGMTRELLRQREDIATIKRLLETAQTQGSVSPVAATPSIVTPAPAQAVTPNLATPSAPVAPEALPPAQPASSTEPASPATDLPKNWARPGFTAQPPSAKPPSPPIEWERWLGIRGAAVLGGIVLAFAALLFFKYSIEHGLLSPTMRVVLGTLAGLGLLVGSEFLQKSYGVTAKALGGAGIVALYASFWAARVLYELIPFEVAFGLMALTTAACVVLALRRDALGIAVMGLVGGFLTPLILATGEDKPIGLFGYVLLLDAAFLFVAIRRSWTSLAVIALLGTVALQGLWIGVRMGPDKLPIALGILGVFTVVFIAAGERAPAEKRQSWFITQAASILVPFAFALYFGATTKFGESLVPIAVLLGFQCVAAGWLNHRRGGELAWLLQAASAASLAVLFDASFFREITERVSWELAFIAPTLAIVLLVFFELGRRRNASEDGLALFVLGLGALAVLDIALVRASSGTPWPWVVGAALLSVVLIRGTLITGLGRIAHFTAGAVGVSLTLLLAAHGVDVGFPPLLEYFGIELGFIVLFHGAALLPSPPDAKRAFALASSWLAAVLSLGAVASPGAEPLLVVLGGASLLSVAGAFGATRAHAGVPLLVGMFAVALSHTSRVFDVAFSLDSGSVSVIEPLAVMFATVLFYVAWPFVAAPALRASRATWYTAALAPVVWFLALLHLYEHQWPKSVGLLPLVLGVVSVAALAGVRAAGSAGDAVRRSAVVWFSAVALGLVSVAIPLQLDKQWITIGWALEGAAVIVLWKRLDHSGLKWFGFALLSAVSVRLAFNPYVLEYGARGMPIVNWILYTYAVPIAAILVARHMIAPLELERVRPREAWLYGQRASAVLATALAVYAIALVFVWLNLTIVDFFSTGRDLTLDFERRPAKDLTMSIAWGLYAIALLALGMSKGSRGLRWTSLVLLLITIGKVFFYDLAKLEDLYRVMSFVGLGISLIVVSLAYQKFVFRKDKSS